MKGATAEPCARITSPPKISSISRIGVSQYFLRTRRNAQSSARIDMTRLAPVTFYGRMSLSENRYPLFRDMRCDSELLLHRLGRGRRSVAHDPVAVEVLAALERQQVLATQPHQPAGRRHRDEEDEPHHHRAHHL